MTPVAYRAVIFDLFDTLVLFDGAVPTVRVAGTERRTTMSWLRARFDAELPGASFDRFLAAMAAVTEAATPGSPAVAAELLAYPASSFSVAAWTSDQESKHFGRNPVRFSVGLPERFQPMSNML